MAKFSVIESALVSAILLIGLLHVSPTFSERAELDQVAASRCSKALKRVNSFEKLQIFLNDLDQNIDRGEISRGAVAMCTGVRPAYYDVNINEFKTLLSKALQGNACDAYGLSSIRGDRDMFNDSPLELWWAKFVLQLSAQCEQSLVEKLQKTEKSNSELEGHLRVALLFAQKFHLRNSKAATVMPTSSSSSVDKMSLDELADQVAISDLRELTQYKNPDDRKNVEYEFKLPKSQYKSMERIFKACDSIKPYSNYLINPLADLDAAYGLETTNGQHLKKWLVASEICKIIHHVRVFTEDDDDDEYLNVQLNVCLNAYFDEGGILGMKKLPRKLPRFDVSQFKTKSDILTEYNQGEKYLLDYGIDHSRIKNGFLYDENMLKVLADSISDLSSSQIDNIL